MHYSREHGNSLSVPVSAKATDSLSPVIAPTLNHSTSVKWKYQRIYLMEFDNDYSQTKFQEIEATSTSLTNRVHTCADAPPAPRYGQQERPRVCTHQRARVCLCALGTSHHARHPQTQIPWDRSDSITDQRAHTRADTPPVPSARIVIARLLLVQSTTSSSRPFSVASPHSS